MSDQNQGNCYQQTDLKAILEIKRPETNNFSKNKLQLLESADLK